MTADVAWITGGIRRSGSTEVTVNKSKKEKINRKEEEVEKGEKKINYERWKREKREKERVLGFPML